MTACVCVCVCVCMTAVCEFVNCCADITLREGLSKCACARSCVRVSVCAWVIKGEDRAVSKLSYNKFISRESSPGLTDGNDVFYN